MWLHKNNNPMAAKGNKFLINITVWGSAGPIRFFVDEGQLVAAVIGTALKSYAREGRLPALGHDLDNFMLYCPCAPTEALSPLEKIGSIGSRKFVLYKKQPRVLEKMTSGRQVGPAMARKNSGIWKSWFH